MSAPGISIKPATTMYDGSFANIFYDGVRVPADHLIGPVNGGWKVLTDALANERGQVGGGIVLKVAHAFDLLCRDVRANPELRRDPLVRERMGTLAADIEVGPERRAVHALPLDVHGVAADDDDGKSVGALSTTSLGLQLDSLIADFPEDSLML